MPNTYTTQRQIRRAFWAEFAGRPEISRRRIDGSHNATTRTTFADFVDRLARDGWISAALAQRVTL